MNLPLGSPDTPIKYEVIDVTAAELFGKEYNPQVGFEISSSAGWGLAFDSFRPETSDGSAVLEEKVLDIRFVDTRENRQHREIIPKAGTKIVESIIKEAVRRRLNPGRVLIHNAKIIRILEKLESKGAITDLKLLPSSDTVMSTPTRQLLDWPEQLSDHEAIKKWLNDTQERDNDGFSNNAVVGIFKIGQID